MDKKADNKKMLLNLIAIVLLVVIVITIILTIQLKKQLNKDGNVDIAQESKGEEFINTYGKEEKGTIDKNSYIDVMNCAKQYFDAINIKNDAYYAVGEDGNYTLIVDENELKGNIYNMLSKTYINRNNITIQNLYEKIETLETPTLLVPLEISMVQDSDIKSFIMHILLETSGDYQVIKDVYIIVNIDIVNSIFSIEPVSGSYKSIKEIKISQLDKLIEKNNNNTFTPSYATNEEMSKDYINLYKRLSLGDTEKMYNLLDENYRTNKFGNLENFKKYIQNRKNQIISTRLDKYQVTRNDNYTQYVCIDQNENYYIIKENGVLDYSIILDTYTIDLPEFTQQYEEANDEEKILLNIQKVFSAINDGDYKYAYSKLDETFKNNNFKTQLDFQNYIQKTFFAKNKLITGSVQKQGDIYLYNITIKDKTEKDDKTISKKIVMKLKEGTDFIMSFEV